MNIRNALLSSLLITPAMALAAGTSTKAPSPGNMYVGVNLGSAMNVAELSAFYDGTLNKEAHFENTAVSTGMLAGLTFGYGMQMGASNNLNVAMDINFNSGMLKQTMHLDSSSNPSTESFDLIQSVSPKMQYNLMLSYGYTVTPSFSTHVNLGGSMLVADHSIAIHDVGDGDADDLAGKDSSGDTSVAGGILGFGTTHKLSPTSDINFDINYYMYGTAKFDNLDDVINGASVTDNLSERKAVFSMPAFTISYHYGF